MQAIILGYHKNEQNIDKFLPLYNILVTSK